MSESNHNHEPAIGKWWKYAAIAGNLALGMLELASGGTHTLAVAADGIHNVGDAVVYGVQSDDLLNPDIAENKLQQRRFFAYSTIAALSAVVGVKSGLELITSDTAEPTNNYGLYAASASLAYSSALLARLKLGIKRAHSGSGHDGQGACHKEHDLLRHLVRNDLPSAALAVAGAVAQRNGIANGDNIAGLLGASLSFVSFVPTKSNLNHRH